jgi:hypothetical protein
MVVSLTYMVVSHTYMVVGGHTCLALAEAVVCGGGGVAPQSTPWLSGRAVYESNGIDKASFNRSMKMTVQTMGPHTDFKQ